MVIHHELVCHFSQLVANLLKFCQKADTSTFIQKLKHCILQSKKNWLCDSTELNEGEQQLGVGDAVSPPMGARGRTPLNIWDFGPSRSPEILACFHWIIELHFSPKLWNFPFEIPGHPKKNLEIPGIPWILGTLSSLYQGKYILVHFL